MEHYSQDGSNMPDNHELAGILFNIVPELRDWIAGTKLFQALVIHSGRPEVTVIGFEELFGRELGESIILQLNTNVVTEPEDLPHELILEFIKNAPHVIQRLVLERVGVSYQNLIQARQSLLN